MLLIMHAAHDVGNVFPIETFWKLRSIDVRLPQHSAREVTRKALGVLMVRAQLGHRTRAIPELRCLKIFRVHIREFVKPQLERIRRIGVMLRHDPLITSETRLGATQRRLARAHVLRRPPLPSTAVRLLTLPVQSHVMLKLRHRHLETIARVFHAVRRRPERRPLALRSKVHSLRVQTRHPARRAPPRVALDPKRRFRDAALELLAEALEEAAAAPAAVES